MESLLCKLLPGFFFCVCVCLCVWWNHCRPYQSKSLVGGTAREKLSGDINLRLLVTVRYLWSKSDGVWREGWNLSPVIYVLCLSVSLSCAIFCSPSAARPSLRQAQALSSNSAALADVLHLTLPHHGALWRHAAIASLCAPPPNTPTITTSAWQRVITGTHKQKHTLPSC